MVRHFDVIVYDKINPPVLWVEKTLDKSEHGERRAIPAKYVHSVFEVKSTFNSKSIKEALEKALLTLVVVIQCRQLAAQGTMACVCQDDDRGKERACKCTGMRNALHHNVQWC